MGAKNYDFSGYATRNDLKCSDGRTIRRNAFKECDGVQVPLVWQHSHNEPENVLGHAILENREDGVYTYGYFNPSASGENAKLLVEHGDIKNLSIYANQLKQVGGDVLHGVIREVSLVLAGANPGACIDYVAFSHSDGEDGEYEAVIYSGDDIVISHADEEEETADMGNENEENVELEHADDSKKTLQDVFDTLNEEQKNLVYQLVGMVMEDESDEDKSGGKEVKHNLFDGGEEKKNVLSHDAMNAIFADAKRLGSLKESVLQHAEDDPAVGEATETVQDYGIRDIDWLFPDARNVTPRPEFIKRDTTWVAKVMGAVSHSPFSRIKSMFADITEDDARAKGYMKGNRKKDEVFGLLKRSTSPQTVYKKQKLDRDDIIDITDFDVVAWIKGEMRIMLDEEIARALLVGDGRPNASDDKINELNIRPVWTDDDLFTIKKTVDYTTTPKNFIRTAIRARKDYKGSGNPVLYTTEDILTDLLLLEDLNGRIIYDTEEKLRTALRVRDIVTVPVMENLVRTDNDGAHALLGIIVNLSDYKVGADRGGAIALFDDFDIDYNQQKYLIETRCSGALVKPYSAIVLEMDTEVEDDTDEDEE